MSYNYRNIWKIYRCPILIEIYEIYGRYIDVYNYRNIWKIYRCPIIIEIYGRYIDVL